MAVPSLMNMQMDAEEAKEQYSPCCEAKAPEGPLYPWGLELHLDDKALQKLGITELKVGSTVTIIAKATVTSASTRQMQGGDAESNCDVQITDMQVTVGGPEHVFYPTMQKK